MNYQMQIYIPCASVEVSHFFDKTDIQLKLANSYSISDNKALSALPFIERKEEVVNMVLSLCDISQSYENYNEALRKIGKNDYLYICNEIVHFINGIAGTYLLKNRLLKK